MLHIETQDLAWRILRRGLMQARLGISEDLISEDLNSKRKRKLARKVCGVGWGLNGPS
jgi:hypothetical protein